MNNNNQKDMPNDQEMNKKRKTNEFQIPRRFPSSDHLVDEDDDNDFLALSLSCYPAPPRPKKLPPVLPPPPQQSMQLQPLLLPQPPPPPPPLPPSSYSLYMPTIPMPPPPPPAPQQPTSAPVVPDSRSSPPPPLPTSTRGRESSIAGTSRATRQRRSSSSNNPSQPPPRDQETTETVPAPYPWATTHRATVHSLSYLLSRQMSKISGEVQCKRCDRQFEMEFDLREKFVEVGTFIAENKSGMHDRAPGVWMNPVLPGCESCHQENCVRPIISANKDSINWLFLLLGQMLGCCTLEQLKYFCQHTKNHRTGAKDRVLYLTYLGLCKQLDPNGPFDR